MPDPTRTPRAGEPDAPRACESCVFWAPTREALYDSAESAGQRMHPMEIQFGDADWPDRNPEASNNYEQALDADRAWGICTRELHSNPPMFTMDASQFSSSLRTQAEFFCQAWQSR